MNRRHPALSRLRPIVATFVLVVSGLGLQATPTSVPLPIERPTAQVTVNRT